MARKRKGLARKQMRVAPYFVSLLVITGLLWLVVFAGVGFKGFPGPRLGLDLQGGMTMTLKASLPDGGVPDADSMALARQIIENRVNGTGVAEPEVFVEGSDNIVVNVAGKETDREELRKIGAPAELRFREVLMGPVEDYTAQDPADFEKAPDDEASPTDDSSSSEEEADADGDATDGDSADEADDETAPSDDASPSTEQGADPADVDSSIEQRREEVFAKLGDDLVANAQDLVEQQASTGQPLTRDQIIQMGVMQTFAPFGDLEPDEVAVLPPDMQFYIPTIGCGQLTGRTPGTIADPEEQVVACESPDEQTKEAAEEANQNAPYAKYLMANARVLGEDVSSAAIQPDQSNPGKWAVSITFSGAGTDKWTSLAADTVNRNVAIVLDNEVISAPTIQPGAASGGQVEITGDFTADGARLLSEQLKYGALPAAFSVETIDVVSATLGLSQLEAGLIAGGIGLLLVVLYCLAYYRFLGLVVIASLLVATVLIYPMVVMLGQQIGLTLTLAGIAGFIVAIGITADAFVVMFERLKDEIKEGRSARSAVPRAWIRARRTIVSANVVNFMSAVVLYILGIGVVKGFAFALGLSTIAGIILVFLFTHPLVSLLSRGKILDSRRMSGIHVGSSSGPRPTVGSMSAANAKD